MSEQEFAYIREFVRERDDRVRHLEAKVRGFLAAGDLTSASQYADRILCLMGSAITAQVGV